MSKIRCYVIDDEMFSIKLLQKYISTTQGLSFEGGETNPIKALKQITQKDVNVDVCFVDIEMQGLSGIDLARKLAEFNIPVIFTTAHQEFLPDAFSIRSVDYVLKPFDYPRFLRSIVLLNNFYKDKFVIIKPAGSSEFIKIPTDQILYIESVGNYCNIVTETRKYITYMTLKSAYAWLARQGFIKIHRSFIINFSKMIKFDNPVVTMENGEHLPVGEAHRMEVIKRIDEQLLVDRRHRN